MLKYHVKAGGGIWEGVQPHLMDSDGATVFFRNPEDGALLKCDVHTCNSVAVRWIISEHKRKQGEKPIKIQRSVLVHILDKLTELAEEVKQLIEEKR